MEAAEKLAISNTNKKEKTRKRSFIVFKAFLVIAILLAIYLLYCYLTRVDEIPSYIPQVPSAPLMPSGGHSTLYPDLSQLYEVD